MLKCRLPGWKHRQPFFAVHVSMRLRTSASSRSRAAVLFFSACTVSSCVGPPPPPNARPLPPPRGAKPRPAPRKSSALPASGPLATQGPLRPPVPGPAPCGPFPSLPGIACLLSRKRDWFFVSGLAAAATMPLGAQPGARRQPFAYKQLQRVTGLSRHPGDDIYCLFGKHALGNI